MQVKYFFIIFVFVLCSGIFFWYKIEEDCKHKKFIQDVEYSMTLLAALENNKTKTVKYLLAADVDRFFLLIANGDEPQKYLPLCRIMKEKNIEQLEKLTINDKKLINIFPDINKTNNQVRKGMRLFFEYCQKQN